MTKILYHPVSVDSINKNAKIIRHSEDRVGAMLLFCKNRYGESFSEKTFLDIGCCYGYFLDAFSEHCADVKGIEYGNNQIKMSKIFYPNIADKIDDSDFTESLQNYDQYDIVALLSVIHTIIISDGDDYAAEMLRIVDEKTKDILFLDMGQEHEALYEYELDGWNRETIAEWILDNTTFDVCKPLMQDDDQDLGRTLFVCYRNN